MHFVYSWYLVIKFYLCVTLNAVLVPFVTVFQAEEVKVNKASLLLYLVSGLTWT